MSSLPAIFAPLIGQWHGVETVAPSTVNPEGSTLHVAYAFRTALDGAIVIADYQQLDGGFESMGVYRRARRGQTELISFDNTGVPPERFAGPFKAGRMVLVGENDYGRWRLIQTISDGSFRSRLELWNAGWRLFSEGVYHPA
jgi:hypothetical protein